MADKKITDLTLRDEFDDDCNFPVDDTIQTYRATAGQVYNYLKSNWQKQIGYMKNTGLQVSAAAGAATVALKQSDGTSNPATLRGEIVEVGFRSTTLTSGAQEIVEFNAALSLVIPSGATLGYQNADNARVFCYLYYDGTNKGLCVSSRQLDESQLYSLVAIGTGSDSNAIYADANRTSAAVRLIGVFQCSAITTAGTWVTPTWVVAKEMMPSRKGLIATKIFTSSSTYYKNPDADFIKVTVVGGGGGGGGSAANGAGNASCAGGGGAGGVGIKTIQNSALADSETVTVGTAGSGGSAGANNGTAGNTSSFGSHVSCTGGGAGQAGTSTAGSGAPGGGAGGVATGADYSPNGQNGMSGRTIAGGYAAFTGHGGSGPLGFGGIQVGSTAGVGSGYGAGGAGALSNPTEGARAGGNGSAGIVIVEEYKL